MLQIKNLSKEFGSLRAVSNLSLEVKPKEIYGFIGPNGAGKTTTIKTIVGLLKPTHGTIKVDPAHNQTQPQKVKSVIGYIPDEPMIYEKLTGREFLHFVGELFGGDQRTRKKKLEELIEIFPLKDIIDGYVGNYSRGNKQKVAILAALLHDPKLLIIDEPIVGLDPQSAKITKDLFKNFARAGGAVFVSTHTLNYAQDLCTKIGVINKGKLIAEGNLTQLRKRIKNSRADLENLYLELTK